MNSVWYIVNDLEEATYLSQASVASSVQWVIIPTCNPPVGNHTHCLNYQENFIETSEASITLEAAFT